MERLDKKYCTCIGSVLKPFGLNGTVILKYAPEWGSSLLQTSVLFAETDGLLVPWFIAADGIRITDPGIALVDLDRISDEKSARKLCGRNIFMVNKSLIAADESSENPTWAGFALSGEQGTPIGIITHEDNFSGNRVLTVKTPEGERLIPCHPDLVVLVDPENKRIILKITPGLLEI